MCGIRSEAIQISLLTEKDILDLRPCNRVSTSMEAGEKNAQSFKGPIQRIYVQWNARSKYVGTMFVKPLTFRLLIQRCDLSVYKRRPPLA